MNEANSEPKSRSELLWKQRLRGIHIQTVVSKVSGIPDEIHNTATQSFPDADGNSVEITFTEFYAGVVYWDLQWKDMFITASLNGKIPTFAVFHTASRKEVSIECREHYDVSGNLDATPYAPVANELKQAIHGQKADFLLASIALTEPALWQNPVSGNPLTTRIVQACMQKG
jgi:hypothetical protein